ncbi:hypothetical protein RE628_06205 [Paenibacillus sp. D2_2]|uniref:hypothetical protein n=1 Tax=Paenibacillus sp. D2_2 TaxID=3073092 RepID=UPI00281570BA|nr:hypothetical protein [Paenibacillus sp. D2_2]WMT42025.1 hypothetical protein RE628_06205 [Paenibacillus sp. D2_2]
MVKCTLPKEELFYLCMLVGAESLLGIEDLRGNLDSDEPRNNWIAVTERLIHKGILSYEGDSELFIDSDYAELVSVLAFPEQAFACLIEDDGEISLEFIHSRHGKYTRLRGEESCEIELLPERDCSELLKEQLLLSDCIEELQFDIPAEILNYAFALAGTGAVKSSAIMLEPYGLNYELAEELSRAVHDGTLCRVVAGYRFNRDQPIEALFHCVRTEQGTWITCMRQDREQVRLFRQRPEVALKQIIQFHGT